MGNCQGKNSFSLSKKRKKPQPTKNDAGFKSINAYNLFSTKTHPIENDYLIFYSKKLGSGMNGDVYMCQNRLTKNKYALKKLVQSKSSVREIRLQWKAALNCENIVKIVDVYENRIEDKKYLLVVMEYCEGGELFEKIRLRKKPFTEQEVAKIMLQICKAVSHLHSMGIAHRDLKPENLLLKSKDENSSIKLSDFGFAKEAEEGLITPNYTPYYVPPEILRFQKYDISCDIWSLGVIMYILCCGYPPFYSTHGQRISPGMEKRIKLGKYDFPETEWHLVSNEAKSLIDGMLETVPERRLTIEEIMKNKWIMNHTLAPKIRLNSIKIMNFDKKNWNEIVTNMSQALNEMRVNYEQNVKLKEINEVQNLLLKKRLEKSKNREEKLKNLELKLKRTNSMPIDNSDTFIPKSPLSALYYTTLIKEESVENKNKLNVHLEEHEHVYSKSFN